MVPPKKKRRVVHLEAENGAPESTAGAGGGGSSEAVAPGTKAQPPGPTTAGCLSRKDELAEELVEALDSLESSPGGSPEAARAHARASLALLGLRALQRALLERVGATRDLLSKQASARDQQALVLENLSYQRALHGRSRLRSEAASERAAAGIKGLCGGGNEASVLETFLGADWKDPSERPAIVSRLNHEVAVRRDLEAKREALRADRRSKQEMLAARQKVLRDLPTRLAEMEKASLPLQKFFQKAGAGGGLPLEASPRIGTTRRRNRLDLAGTLPPALYTLFHQLQSSLDVLELAARKETPGGNKSGSSIGLSALPTLEVRAGPGSKTQDATVLLRMPIPTVSDGGGLSYHKFKKLVPISFRYEASSDLVLACCGNDYGMGQVVLGELFPGDRGEYLAASASASASASATPAALPGRAYQWCNALAGLHVSPASATAARQRASAGVVLSALVRRVRAVSTLSHILVLLPAVQGGGLPSHDRLKDRHPEALWADAAGLVAWKAVVPAGGGRSGHVRVYEAVLRKDGGPYLEARVSVDHARYPSVAPRWRLSPPPKPSSSEQGPRQGLPLYDEGLAKLEKDVNGGVLDRLVDPSDQTTYDWVLAQQLIEIAVVWGRREAAGGESS